MKELFESFGSSESLDSESTELFHSESSELFDSESFDSESRSVLW